MRGPGCLTSLPCPEKCVAGWGAFNFPRSSRRCSTPGLDPERNLGPFSSPFYLNNFQNGVSAKNFDVPTGPLCNSPSIFGKVSMYKIFVNSKRCNLCTRPSFFERTFSRKDATLPRTNAGSSCLGELAAIRKAAFSTGSFDIRDRHVFPFKRKFTVPERKQRHVSRNHSRKRIILLREICTGKESRGIGFSFFFLFLRIFHTARMTRGRRNINKWRNE